MNQRRTVKGSQIVAIGLISVYSTTLLLQGFSSEISIISSQLNNEDLTYSIESKNGDSFSKYQQNELMELKHQFKSIIYLNLEQHLNGNLSTGEISNIEVPIKILNLSLIIDHFSLDINDVANPFVTSDIQSLFNLRENQPIYIETEFSLASSNLTIIDSKNSILSTGIYLSQLYMENKFKPSIAIMELSNTDSINQIVSILDSLDLELQLIRAEADFSRISAQNLETTLIILQLAVSILVILSILNLMNLLILESKDDIKVLLSVGFSYNQVWMVFITIGLFVGLVGGMLTILISFSLVSGILAFMSSLGFPYVIVNIVLSDMMSILLNSTLITIIATLYPSYRGVRNSL